MSEPKAKQIAIDVDAQTRVSALLQLPPREALATTDPDLLRTMRLRLVYAPTGWFGWPSIFWSGCALVRRDPICGPSVSRPRFR